MVIVYADQKLSKELDGGIEIARNDKHQWGRRFRESGIIADLRTNGLDLLGRWDSRIWIRESVRLFLRTECRSQLHNLGHLLDRLSVCSGPTSAPEIVARAGVLEKVRYKMVRTSRSPPPVYPLQRSPRSDNRPIDPISRAIPPNASAPSRGQMQSSIPNRITERLLGYSAPCAKTARCSDARESNDLMRLCNLVFQCDCDIGKDLTASATKDGCIGTLWKAATIHLPFFNTMTCSSLV